MARRLPPSPWAPLRWPVLLLGAVVACGVAGYMMIEGWSFVDALYMTLITLTTVGFKEVHPLDTSGAVLTMSLLVMGVTLVVVTLSLAAGSIAQGGLGERGRRRKMQRRIEAMHDHYIICAYGRVGRTVVEEFASHGIPCVIIETNEDLEEDLIEDGVPYIIDDAISDEVLIEAGVERARGLVCAVDSDAENVFITLTARSLNPDIFIVARASEPTTAQRLIQAGADRVVSPYVTSGRHMALLALRPGVVDYLEVGASGTPPLRLEELQITPDSELVSRSLSDCCEGKVALAVRRADGNIVASPPADLELREGDLVVLLESPAPSPREPHLGRTP